MSYAPINGMQMYYEEHGSGGVPLILLHGALSATETSFGPSLPGLAEHRQVIAVEQQSHGRTADIDRPLSHQQMAEDTVALLQHLGHEKVDLFGYSMGAAIALNIAIQHPELVRKLIVASLAVTHDGLHPGLIEGVSDVTPEMLAGSPFEEEYLRLAPNPGDWPTLVAKNNEQNKRLPEWTTEQVAGIQAPVLIMIGDSDIIRPEHGPELFRLVGGGVIGDMAGLPASRLAILPGTTHVTLPHQAELIVPMVSSFLDQPSEEGNEVAGQ